MGRISLKSELRSAFEYYVHTLSTNSMLFIIPEMILFLAIIDQTTRKVNNVVRAGQSVPELYNSVGEVAYELLKNLRQKAATFSG